MRHPAATRAFWPPLTNATSRTSAIVEPIRLGALAHIVPTHVPEEDEIVNGLVHAYATAPPLIRLRRFRAHTNARDLLIDDGNHRLLALRRLLQPNDWILVEVER